MSVKKFKSSLILTLILKMIVEATKNWIGLVGPYGPKFHQYEIDFIIIIIIIICNESHNLVFMKFWIILD